MSYLKCAVFFVMGTFVLFVFTAVMLDGYRTGFSMPSREAAGTQIDERPLQEWQPTFVDKALNPGIKEMTASPIERLIIEDLTGDD